jgi:hypothetical protein
MSIATAVDLSAVVEFVRISDRLAKLAADTKKAEAELKAMERLAMARVPSDGSLLVVEVDGATRTVKCGDKVSYTQTASDADAVAFAQLHGLNVSVRSPEILAPATLRSAALKGLDVSDIAQKTTSPVLIVD